MDDEQRKALAKSIADRRRAIFGTKSAAYSKAGVNAATWDRAEAGDPIREDRLTAIIKALWPQSDGDPGRIKGNPEDWPEWPDSDHELWDHSDASTRNDMLMSWVAENFVQINRRLADLESAIRDREPAAGLALVPGLGDGGASADLSDLDDTMAPAASDVQDDDEAPGGSDPSDT